MTLSTVAGLVPEIRVRETEPGEVARLKGDARMAKVLARAVRTRQRPLQRRPRGPLRRPSLRLSAAESAQIVGQARRRPGPHNARRRLVEQAVSAQSGRPVARYVQRRRASGSSTADTG